MTVYPMHYLKKQEEKITLEIHNSKSDKIRYLGIIYDIVIGLDHGVTISIDSNGTDWTGYLGGIILTDDEHDLFFNDNKKEDDSNE